MTRFPHISSASHHGVYVSAYKRNWVSSKTVHRVFSCLIRRENELFLTVFNRSNSVNDISDLLGGRATTHFLETFPGVPHVICESTTSAMLVEAETNPRFDSDAEIVTHQTRVNHAIFLLIVLEVSLFICFWIHLKIIESHLLIYDIFDL
jgi:hypothetical protein